MKREVIYEGHSVKELVMACLRKNGRNFHGRMTSFHKGGAVYKRRYRCVDYLQEKRLPFVVRRIEYDPNRSAFLGLVLFTDGSLSYILAYEGIAVGQIRILHSVQRLNGIRIALRDLDLGSIVHNLEQAYARSAGSGVQIVKYMKGEKIVIRLRSGQLKIFRNDSLATIGFVSNVYHFLTKMRKAGDNRHRGIKPTVRGVAMNPVDHPHGGGEGKSSGGRPSVSPWGVLTKGYKTRRKKIFRRNKN